MNDLARSLGSTDATPKAAKADVTLYGVGLADALSRVLMQTMGDMASFSFWSDSKAAAAACADTLPALVLWDHQTSLEGLRSLLAACDPAPFVMMLGAGADSDEGVDETLEKPFRLGFLRQRLVSILAMRKRLSDARAEWPAWQLDGRNRCLRAKGREAMVLLTDKEAALLAYLGRAGGAVSKDVLLADVWGYEGGLETHTLETHLYRLRRKLIEVGFAGAADPIVVEGGRISLGATAGNGA